MARRLLFGLALLVAGLSVVLCVRALRLSSLQPVPRSLPVLPINADAAARRLAGGLQIATVSDGPTAPVRGEEFTQLHSYLETQFPRVHSSLVREVLGGYSLLYTWPGRNRDLAPAVLLGHLDVVPVEPGTERAWEHPPFSGAIANGFIWGRGALDDKFTVFGLLEAAELLLADGFQPQRTVFFAFGHDEELGGDRGAAVIAAELERRGVTADFVLDEGGAVMEKIIPGVANPLACIGVAEKGNVQIRLEAHAEGGHSSAPPTHTAIGVLAAAIASLERTPLPPRFSAPVQGMLRHLAPELPLIPHRLVLANLWLFAPVLLRALSAEPATNASVRTTAATTMIAGGVKENVLPSKAWAVVNYRILPGDSAATVLAHVRKVVAEFGIHADMEPPVREPTPVSPVDGPAYARLAGVIRSVFPQALVVPYLTIGGTDARHYSRVSRNVYRFMPLVADRSDLARMHGTNERVRVTTYRKAVEFYAHLLTTL